MRAGFLLIAVVLLAVLGCSISGPTSDGSPPDLLITAPVDGDSVSGSVSIDALATDNFGVDKVRFLVDGTLLAEVFSEPYHASWSTAPVANRTVHEIRVEALDVAKNLSSKTIHVLVVKGTQ